MKHLQVSEDIVPIGQFKAHASKLIRGLRGSKRPLVITQNGKPAAVVVTPEEFDRLVERRRFVEAVGDGLRDADSGRVVSDAELARELVTEFGR